MHRSKSERMLRSNFKLHGIISGGRKGCIPDSFHVSGFSFFIAPKHENSGTLVAFWLPLVRTT
jgi:hypothetical protein